MKNEKTKILVECAMLVALGCVLSIFPKFRFLPNGGSVTVCSMLPIVLVSYRRGLKWGLLSAFVFSLFQMLIEFVPVAAVSVWATVGVVALDYILAFTVLGIGGLFRGKLGGVRKELISGVLLAFSLRLLLHTVSGVLLYSSYAEWFFGELGAFGQSILASVGGAGLYWLYSFIYNASYMIPEMIITCAVAAVLAPHALYGLSSQRAVSD